MGKAEAKIEDYLKEQVEKAGGLCWKLSPTLAKGIPDRLVILGKVALVETKAKRGRLSPIQHYRREQILKNGGSHYVISSKTQVDELVRQLQDLQEERQENGNSSNNDFHHPTLRAMRLGDEDSR